jgi:DNA-binding NarL/FixJ family response regulator
MSKFNSAITEAMEALDAEIDEVEGELEQLKATRANLESVLVEDDSESPKRSKKVTKEVTDEPRKTTRRESTKRERIMHMLRDGVKVSTIAEEVDVAPNYVYTIRREEGLDTGERGKRGPGRPRTSSNGDSDRTSRSKVTKRQQIADMLADDMSVKDIAKELGISPSYVYNVKGSL